MIPRGENIGVLFVAAVDPIAGGGAGGQLTASSTLLRSDFSKCFRIVTLSTTMISIPPPAFPARLRATLMRLVKFARRIWTVQVVVIFLSDGLGLLEKLLFAGIARILRRGVVVRFGSGKIPDQCKSSGGIKLLVRMILRSAHRVCTQSASWSQFFREFNEARGKLVEARNPVEIPPLVEKSVSTGSSRIAFVGWLEEHKGVYELLSILKGVHSKVSNARLSIAGGGSERHKLQLRAQELGIAEQIEFLGWRSKQEVDQLLENTDVFLFPSHFEGMPNAVLEAMAHGVPVVATKVGALADVLSQSAGYLHDVGDVVGMTKSVLHLLGDSELRRQMGRAGRAIIVSRYDASQVWKDYGRAVKLARQSVYSGSRTQVGMESAQTADLFAYDI